MSMEAAGDGTIRMSGHCAVEEAEVLLGLLLAEPGAAVDWSGCRGAHGAVVQLLLALRPPMLGLPEDAFLRRWVAPLLGEGGAPGGQAPDGDTASA